MTSLKIDRETRQRLEAVKVHPRETVGDVIRRLLDHIERREPRRDAGRKAS